MFAMLQVAHYFDDPDGKIEMPPCLRVYSWKRPTDFIIDKVYFLFLNCLRQTSIKTSTSLFHFYYYPVENLFFRMPHLYAYYELANSVLLILLPEEAYILCPHKQVS